MYEITITKKRRPLEVRPLTKDEYENTYLYERKEGKVLTKHIYGYAPEIQKQVAHVQEVLKQQVEELDLAAVIKAINKL